MGKEDVEKELRLLRGVVGRGLEKGNKRVWTSILVAK